MNVYIYAGERGGVKQGEDFMESPDAKHERGKAVTLKA